MFSFEERNDLLDAHKYSVELWDSYKREILQATKNAHWKELKVNE